MSQITTERSGQLEVRAAADGSLTFPLSSEEPYGRIDGDEILVHTKEACDLSWLNSGNAPLLDNHNRYSSVMTQIGVITRAWLSEKRLYVTVKFSNRPEAQAIRQDIADGVIRNVSVGYEIFQTKRGDNNSYFVTSWKPSEASIVPVPADTTVGIGRSATATRMEAFMPLDNPTAPATAERKMPGVLTEAERASAMETAMNEVRALAATHTISNLGEAFIEAAVRGGVAPSIEVFRGIVRSKLPEGVALRNTDIGLTQPEKRQFSILRLARAMADNATPADMQAAAFEIEACEAARVEASKEGRATKGAYTIPTDLMSSWGDFTVDGYNSRGVALSQMRAPIGVAAGANLLDPVMLSDRFIDNLRNQSAVLRAGAVMLPGLQNNVDIPGGNSNNAASWLATEAANVVESNPTFRKITLSPKDLGSFVDLTRRMLQQSNIALEQYVRQQITTGIVLEIDRAALYGTGASGQPTGINATAGIGSIALAATASTGIPTRGELIDGKKTIALTNRGTGSLKWLMNSSTLGDLQKTTVDAGSGVFLLNDAADRLLGLPVIESNQIPAGALLNDIWCGAFEDVLVGMWGSMDLDRDVAAGFLAGTVRLRGIQTIDIGVQRVGSFCKLT